MAASLADVLCQTTIGATLRVAEFVRIPSVEALEKPITDRQNADSMIDTAPNGEHRKNAPDDLAPGSADRLPLALLRRADQLGIATLALFALVSIGGYWLTQAVIRGRVIDIEKAPTLDPGFRVDLNSAEWPELAQLPEIGESLARQIVAYRTAHGPFQDVNELRRVKGIGPKKFEAVRPFLRAIGRRDQSQRAVAKEDQAAAGHR